MYAMGLAIGQELADFPGGPQGLSASVTPAAEALRIMRWPAERLDTLGGYLTYHNVVLIALFLAIYGAVQGTRAVRGGEDRHSIELILATGWTRRAVVRDRALGFFIVMVAISVGLGLGTAAAMAGGGAPDLAGSLITLAEVGLCAMVGYSLGLLVSQLTSTSRMAAGVSSIVLTALYVATNVWEEMGALGAVRFVSPFYYSNLSRALVPGHGLDVSGTAALVVMSLVLIGLAAWAFERRDYGAALWERRRARAPRAAVPGRRGQRVFGSACPAMLFRGRFSLLAWAGGAGLLCVVMMLLEPTVIEMWSVFGTYMPGMSGQTGIPVEAQYAGFSAETVALVIVAYVIAQATGWVGDLADGRVEAVLATPVSWSRLVWERLLALLIGVVCVAGGAIAGLVLGAIAVDFQLDAGGIARLAADCLLFGAALGGVAAIVVAAVPKGGAVTVLSALVAVSYMQGYLATIFNWPGWVERFSLFRTFGNPYVGWAGLGEAVFLLVLAVPGALLAAAIAERTPKVG